MSAMAKPGACIRNSVKVAGISNAFFSSVIARLQLAAQEL